MDEELINRLEDRHSIADLIEIMQITVPELVEAFYARTLMYLNELDVGYEYTEEAGLVAGHCEGSGE